ncbi:MAG: aminotransferase class I/II-fold pyridoxal phosphate-dependent enzyme [Acidimicrobiia bacterium]|jgi:succinyldiaminopimelate transaminase
MRINPVLEGLGTYPIAAIHDRARAMRAAGARLVDFSVGDPREPTPPFIAEALKAAVPAVSQYPTTKGLPALRQAVAGYVRRRFGVAVDPETQVLPTTGSKEAIFSTPLAFVDRQARDVVVWPTPGYPIYERGALLAGAEGHPARLDGDFVFRPDRVPADVWPRTRVLWTCSPHNPTGSVMGRADLEAVCATARLHDTLVCADECYADLYEDEPPPSILEVAGPGSPGALSYLSLSKRSGMTGYRSAAVVGDPVAIAGLASLRSSTGTAPPEFTQAAAIAAWSDDIHVAERRQIFRAKRAVLRRGFEAMGLEVVASGAGLYLWVRVGDDVAVTERLLEGGVVVSPGRAFGPGGEGFIRLALVPTLDECDAAVEAVRACLAGI